MSVLALSVILAFVTPQAGSTPAPKAQSQPAGDAREMTLVLPHALRKGETAWLLVAVGMIGHNQIQLTTQSGKDLGTISPFGIRSGQAAGTYTIPVPAEALSGRRLILRLSVPQADGLQRATTTEEVKSVRLVIQRFGNGN
jgi:hypothetical protein